jgi:nucleotide-binding universal stress UspA family protein
MQRFKNILVVLDQGPYDDVVLDRAVRLSGANRARVTVRAMVRGAPAAFRELEKQHGLEAARHRFEARLLERLVKTTLRVNDQSKIGSVGAIEADSFLDILREVLRGKHDLVMIPAEAPASGRDVFLGSTPMHLLRKCPCPVWVFKPPLGGSREPTCQRILAAVDALAPWPTEQDLNVKILELATSLARQEKADLSVIHCWSAHGELLPFSTEDSPPAGLDQYIRDVRREHRTRFKDLLAPFLAAGHDIRSHLVKGDPGLLIPRFVKRREIDLVVMGTVARAGIGGLLMGNAAEKTLHRLGCSVLAVKPDEFVSPVR